MFYRRLLAGLLAAVIVAVPVSGHTAAGPAPAVAAKAKKKCKKGHKRNKAGKCVRKKRQRPPATCCVPGQPSKPPAPGPGSPCLISPCTVIASDTAEQEDPIPFWGRRDCDEPFGPRVQRPTSGGDWNPTATGKPQGNDSYRRTTVFDGDDFYGERCELGLNDKYGPVAFYREGQRTVTYWSMRIPNNFPYEVFAWQGGMQMKQAQSSDGGGGIPVLSMSIYDYNWMLNLCGAEPNCDESIAWTAPAQRNVWTRIAWDVTHSQYDSVGRIKMYVDVNGDGDWGDAGEQSPTFQKATLKYEVPGTDSDGLSAGESIPSHLRMGVYHNPEISCPGGCSLEFDNVQVVK